MTSSREVSAADGMGVEEALRTLIELIDVSFSRGKEGVLAITPSTLNRWKKVLPWHACYISRLSV
jgi:hypothetical protein